MERLKYIPLGLFVIAVSKSLILGFTWTDCLAIGLLGAISAYYEFKSNDKQVKILMARADQVDKYLTELFKQQEELRTQYTGVSVAKQFAAQGFKVPTSQWSGAPVSNKV
jgi:predicted aminopeptidase